jgi:hypothetical protein
VCSIDQSTETAPCLPLSVPIGATVKLAVTLTKGAPGDGAIFRGQTTGCDAVTLETCTITMDVDRSVRLGIGCAICFGPDSVAQGMEWSTQANVGRFATSNRPSITLFKGNPFVAWKAAGSDRTIYTTTLA